MKLALLARRTVLAASIDTEKYIEDAFDHIISKGAHSRREAYELLAIHLEDAQDRNVRRCIAVIEKLPTLLETIPREDFDSFLKFLSAMADNVTSDVQNAWNKNLNKFITTMLRMINGREGKVRCFFLMAALNQLATSRVRSSLIPFVKQAKDAGFYILSQQHTYMPYQREIVTDFLASLVSLDSLVQWSSSLNELLLEMAAILSAMTVFSYRGASQDKPEATLLSLDKILVPTITGVNRVQILEGLFYQLNRLYVKILSAGYSTAFVSLDFTGFVVLERAVLSLFSDVNTNDPAVFIENEDRISKVDVALVSSRLKVSVLKTLQQILQLNLPGLVRYGSMFLHPVCVLLGRREVSTVPLLLQEVLTTLQLSFRVLPNSAWMMLQSTGNVQVLLQLVQVQCELISEERKHFSSLDISHSSLSSKNKKDMEAMQAEQHGNLVFHATAIIKAAANVSYQKQQQQQQQSGVLGKRKHYLDQDLEVANDSFTCMVLATIDALLLHAGRLLCAQPEGKQFLESLQVSLLFPLAALRRGILPSHFQEKKMHRLFAERIRHSKVLQAAVVRTAGNIFLVTGASEHIYLPIVREVANTLLCQVGVDHELCNEAQRLLILTGHLVHPSVLPIPSANPTVLGSELLAREKKRRRQEEEQKDINDAKHDVSGVAAVNRTSTSSGIELSDGLSAPLAELSAKPALSYAASTPSAGPATVSNDFASKLPVVSSNKELMTKPKASISQMDDDDDIPDIDISSDQE